MITDISISKFVVEHDLWDEVKRTKRKPASYNAFAAEILSDFRREFGPENRIRFTTTRFDREMHAWLDDRTSKWQYIYGKDIWLLGIDDANTLFEFRMRFL